MSKGECAEWGGASFRAGRKQKSSRPSASASPRPPSPNSKVSCERLSRLISLSLDENVRWKFVGKSETTVIRRKYVDSEVIPKFRFARVVGTASACGRGVLIAIQS